MQVLLGRPGETFEAPPKPASVAADQTRDAYPAPIAVAAE
jgi:hypothetical protein